MSAWTIDRTYEHGDVLVGEFLIGEQRGHVVVQCLGAGAARRLFDDHGDEVTFGLIRWRYAEREEVDEYDARVLGTLLGIIAAGAAHETQTGLPLPKGTP